MLGVISLCNPLSTMFFFFSWNTGPDSSVGTVSAPGNGKSRVRPRPRHTKVIKNGSTCSSLGTQIYGVELGLVDPLSGYGCGIMS